MTTVFVGDVGTEIILDCGVSITSSTVRKIIARTPNGTIKQWTSSLEGTNSIKYTIVDGDLDRPGEWQLSAYVEMPGWKGSGEITKLTVKPPLNI